ncbi:hypothetical protein RI367_001546, partial [Sorochytrium milnesiophthora]
ATATDAVTIEAIVNLSLQDANAFLAANSSHTLSVTPYDIGDVPAKAVRPAIAANNSGVFGIIGAYWSSSTIPIALVADQLKIWQCSGSATSPKLSDKSQYWYFFRTVTPDNFQGIAHAQLAKSMEWDTVSILYSSDSYGSGIAQAFSSTAATLGVQIASSQLYVYGSGVAGPYDLQLNSIKQAASRIVFVFGYDVDLIGILRAAKVRGMVGNGWTWVGSDAIATYLEQLTAGLGTSSDLSNANGVIAAYPSLSSAPAYPFYFYHDCLMGMAYGLAKVLLSMTPAQVKARNWTYSLADFLVPFPGVTGYVQYDPITLERLGDYTIMNIYNASEQAVYQVSSSAGLVTNLAAPYFADGTSRIPSARPLLAPMYPMWSSPVVIGLTFATLLLVVLVLGANWYLYQHRDLSAVKHMSLPFLSMISAGICMAMLSTLLAVDKPTFQTCSGVIWIFVVGLQMVLCAVAAKTFRIWVIFSANGQVKANASLNNHTLLAGCAVIIAVQCLMLLGWMVVSPPAPTPQYGDTTMHYVCASSNASLQSGVIYATTAYNSVLLLTVMYLAFMTRTAYSAFRESIFILYTCQVFVLCGVIIALFSAMLSDTDASAWSLYMIRTVVVLCGSAFAFACLVGRVVLVVVLKQRADASKNPFPKATLPRSHPRTVSGSGQTSSAVDVRKALRGKYPVRITNQLLSKWSMHHVILFGHSVDSKSGNGLMLNFRSIIFEPDAPADGLCIEFRVLNDAYAVQMPNEADFQWWKETMITYTMVFGRRQGTLSMMPYGTVTTGQPQLTPQLTAESLPSAARLWHIDRKALKQQFLALQRRVHPDAFAAADARVREYSDAQSAFLNKAHNELQHALSRAKYLLKLYGGSVEEDESALPASQELLLYMMDTQEVLEECEEPTQVEDIARENDERISQCLQALSNLFERLPSPLASDQAAVATRQQVQQLKDLVVRLQYLQQLQSAVSDKKHSLSS